MDYSYIDAVVRDYVDEARYRHSIRVSEVAVKLAEVWGEDPETLRLAGLVHDVLKQKSPRQLEAAGFELDPQETALYSTFPLLWHSFAAPGFLKQKLAIFSSDVSGPVLWHTTGKEEMTVGEKILYVADYIEPQRPFLMRGYLEALAFQDLDQATYGVAQSTLLHLLRTGKRVHFYSYQCREYYAAKLNSVDLAMITATLIDSK